MKVIVTIGEFRELADDLIPYTLGFTATDGETKYFEFGSTLLEFKDQFPDEESLINYVLDDLYDHHHGLPLFTDVNASVNAVETNYEWFQRRYEFMTGTGEYAHLKDQ